MHELRYDHENSWQQDMGRLKSKLSSFTTTYCSAISKPQEDNQLPSNAKELYWTTDESDEQTLSSQDLKLPGSSPCSPSPFTKRPVELSLCYYRNPVKKQKVSNNILGDVVRLYSGCKSYMIS